MHCCTAAVISALMINDLSPPIDVYRAGIPDESCHMSVNVMYTYSDFVLVEDVLWMTERDDSALY